METSATEITEDTEMKAENEGIIETFVLGEFEPLCVLCDLCGNLLDLH